MHASENAMPEVVTLTMHDDVAVVTLRNPAVNGLSFTVRTELAGHLMIATQDDTVGAIVMTGAGRMFCGGADIREFDQPPPPGHAIPSPCD